MGFALLASLSDNASLTGLWCSEPSGTSLPSAADAGQDMLDTDRCLTTACSPVQFKLVGLRENAALLPCKYVGSVSYG